MTKQYPASKHSGRSDGGQERKESLQLRLWNLNSTFKSPVGSGRLSCQISANHREEETSSNVTNIERHVPRVMTSLLMSSPPISISHRKSSMHIFNFHRRSCKLYFLFSPRRQSAPESLLAGKQSKGILRSRGVIQQRERHAFWWTPAFVSVELFKVKKKIC